MLTVSCTLIWPHRALVAECACTSEPGQLSRSVFRRRKGTSMIWKGISGWMPVPTAMAPSRAALLADSHVLDPGLAYLKYRRRLRSRLAPVASLRCCRAQHVFFDRRQLDLHALCSVIALSCRRIVASHQLILACRLLVFSLFVALQSFLVSLSPSPSSSDERTQSIPVDSRFISSWNTPKRRALRRDKPHRLDFQPHFQGA